MSDSSFCCVCTFSGSDGPECVNCRHETYARPSLLGRAVLACGVERGPLPLGGGLGSPAGVEGLVPWQPGGSVTARPWLCAGDTDAHGQSDVGPHSTRGWRRSEGLAGCLWGRTAAVALGDMGSRLGCGDPRRSSGCPCLPRAPLGLRDHWRRILGTLSRPCFAGTSSFSAGSCRGR